MCAVQLAQNKIKQGWAQMCAALYTIIVIYLAAFHSPVTNTFLIVIDNI